MPWFGYTNPRCSKCGSRTERVYRREISGSRKFVGIGWLCLKPSCKNIDLDPEPRTD